MAMLVLGLTMVPISAKGGNSCGAAATGAASGGGAAPAAMTGAGGRRDAENSGRSRVAARALSGVAQSGFPLGAAGSRLDAAPARVRSVASETTPSLGTGALAVSTLVV